MATLDELLAPKPVAFGSEVLQEAAKKQHQKRVEKAVADCEYAMSRFDCFVEAYVQDIRTLRSREKRVKSELGKLNAANDFFRETGNPLPLLFIVDKTRYLTLCYELGVDAETSHKLPD